MENKIKMATPTTTSTQQHNAIVDFILKSIPLEIILPMVFDFVLNNIKSVTSSKAKMLKPILVDFAKAIRQKYPDSF